MLKTIVFVFLVCQSCCQQVPDLKMIGQARKQLESTFGLQKQNYLGLRTWKQNDQDSIQLVLEYTPNRLFMAEFKKKDNEYIIIRTQYITNNNLQMKMFATVLPPNPYLPYSASPYIANRRNVYHQGQSVQDMIKMNRPQQKNRQPIVSQFGIQQSQPSYVATNGGQFGFRNARWNRFDRSSVIMNAMDDDDDDQQQSDNKQQSDDQQQQSDDQQQPDNNNKQRRAKSIKYEQLANDYGVLNTTLYPKDAECELYKMYDSLIIKFDNRPIRFVLEYDDDDRTIAKVIEYINERRKIQKDLRKQRRDIQKDVDSKLGWFLFQDPQIINEQKNYLYSNFTRLRDTIVGKKKEYYDDKLVGNIQKFMETIFLESKYFMKSTAIEKKKNGFEDQLGKYFYDYLFNRDDSEIEEDIKVVFVVKDDLLDGAEQTIEYSLNSKNTTRYSDTQLQKLDLGQEDVEIMNHNYVPTRGYNLTTDIEYLKFHNKSIVSTVLKQNKKSEIDNIKYDFSRVINITGNPLVDVFTNNPVDDFNTFLIGYYQQLLKTEKVEYEVKQDFVDIKPLKYYFGENGTQFLKSIYQNLFGNFQLLDFMNEQFSKNPFNRGDDETVIDTEAV